MPQNILIVDDEPAICEVLARVCERAGMSVTIASSAEQGLQKLESSQADTVITDIIMPGMDGIALVEAIRLRAPDVRIIAISGGGEAGAASYKPDAISTTAFLSAAQKAGAAAVLTKPFSRDQILQAIADVQA